MLIKFAIKLLKNPIESMAARRIKEAASQGVFRKLDGHGKPIDLDARAGLATGDDALAAKVLRNS